MVRGRINTHDGRMRILRLLRCRPYSRAELARESGLSRAALTGIADALIGEGLILEGEITRTDKGRRPRMLYINPTAYYSVGIDISREGVNLSVLDFSLCEVASYALGDSPEREETLCEIYRIIGEAKEKYNILGIGVVAPGPVDALSGRILEPDGLSVWHSFSVSEIEEHTGLPTVLRKDTSALALAEKMKVEEDKSFLVLLADHGLGGAFVEGGRLFESACGFGLEIGHISIDKNGERCHCGNRGCAEAIASVTSTVRRAALSGLSCDYEGLISLMKEGNKVAEAALLTEIDALILTAISVSNILEPDLIIIEGELRSLSNLLTDRMEEALRSRRLFGEGHAISVRVSDMPRGARAFCAANLIFDKFFEGERIK